MPLGQLAEIRQVAGPAMISSENGLLVVTVLLNVRGPRRRELRGGGAPGRWPSASPLPPGSYIEWSGQYENEVRARQRLQIVVPVVLVVIFMLLYLTYGSFLDAAQVLLAVPFGLAGGHLPAVRARLQLLRRGLGRASSRSSARRCRPRW